MARQGKEMKDKEILAKPSQGNERKHKARHSSLTTKMNHKIQEYHNNHKMKPKFQSIINMKYLFNYFFYTLFVQ
jgi:hypothetical protein